MSDRVKILIFILIAVFLFQMTIGLFRLNHLFTYVFGLNYQGLVRNLWLWQIFTYMFLHGGFLHIFFNCFALWMFGSELERYWGSRRFTSYFLLSGIGAGLFIALMNLFIFRTYGVEQDSTIGASGAIYALLLAYGMTWPDREVLLYFLFPIKMKYLVLIFGAIEFFGTLNMMSGVAGNISHIGHFGGLVVGFILLRRYRSGAKARGIGDIVSGYLKKQRIKKKKEAVEQRIRAKKIIDRMLDKIARSSVESLTPDEKKDLEWARRHYYPDSDDTLH